MYFSTQFYGRKGLVVNAFRGRPGLWDLLGKLRREPVYHLLGGAVRDELVFYATGSRPRPRKALGFIGGKMPLHTVPRKVPRLSQNIEMLADMRGKVARISGSCSICWMSSISTMR